MSTLIYRRVHRLVAFALVAMLALGVTTTALAETRDLDFGNNGNQEKFYGSTASELVGQVADEGTIENEPYEECPGVTPGKAGWHFVHPGNGELISMEVSFGPDEPYLVLSYPGDEKSVQETGNPKTVTGVYFETELDATLEEAKATGIGGQNFFVLSHVCVPDDFEELTVVKTANTSYTRTHDWSIEKTVDPADLWLYVDGSGDATATWTVTVTYEGYSDSDHQVAGTIEITNSGNVDVSITSIVDTLELVDADNIPVDLQCADQDGAQINLDNELPYSLEVNRYLTCTYTQALIDALEGRNTVSVTIEEREDVVFEDEAPLNWEDADVTEVNDVVTIVDVSDLFDEVILGTLNAANFEAGETKEFTYSKNFAWANYYGSDLFEGDKVCGDLTFENTAYVIPGAFVEEDEIDLETALNSDSETLVIYVQCIDFETAYAMGEDNKCFSDHGFGNWGWTNPITPGEYTWDLWAGAAHCETDKGTLVGTVTVEYDNDGYVTVAYNVHPDLLKETHVYAGTTEFPQQQAGKKTKDTVAPGQYYNDSPFDVPEEVYVIAHAVVGVPGGFIAGFVVEDAQGAEEATQMFTIFLAGLQR